ncbi:hypothetical protein [Novosphingobium sp. 9]|uniref:hypothetical protein n=1 Tax=Novosphingobium sp. 9 TaxID=2025349 RepID=UPI0021B6723C|nr:hypothetical protein [Novosphingobium sp. 9]
MTRHFTPPVHQTAAPSTMLVEAIRCWSEAREAGMSAQPRLWRVLDSHDCTMLTPVLDSLMRLYEIGLGRPVRAGEGLVISEDEHLLLDLIDGRFSRKVCLACTGEIGSALDCAICSTRIMMALTVPLHTLAVVSTYRLQ